MAEATGDPRSEQDSDYDGAWKEAVRLISVRKASRRERRDYEDGTFP